ncbi:killer cell immunoglobulin-like receptor 2DL5A [Elephas maximus indicus]|uniref:killer cell immunoglobulin-like receptor 2DL5A n=1 Tax=Elephas maximus indicus TaxID=99487 RepID=UPI0021163437|nr:killer cell immunoglobulin-like receptor 2DL5A [Elephas maximus indicus]
MSKRNGTYVPELQNRLFNNNFTMSPVTTADSTMSPIMSAYGGTYGCYGSLSHSPYEWSAASDPLELMITDLFSSRPIHETSLLAPLGPMVMSGGNMTLCCSSESSFDMYHLSREGEVHEPCFPGVQSHNGASQADFFLRPVTPAYGGTFRCYRSFIQVVRTK